MRDIPNIPNGVELTYTLKASASGKVADKCKRNFNLPPRVTCPGRTTGPKGCASVCYACKGRMRFTKAVALYWENLHYLVWAQTTNQPEWMVNNAFDDILPQGGIFRIHSGGDFYNQWYLDAWTRAIKAHPGIKFCCHTKSFDLDWSTAVKLSNFFPRASIDPENEKEASDFSQKYQIPLSYGHYPHDQDIPEGTRICPLTDKDFKKIHPTYTCRDCMECWSKSDTGVIFLKH